MTRVLLDTHAVLWWLAGDASLSRVARSTIAEPSNEVLVSSASIWEIAIKRSLGKLTAPEGLLEAISQDGLILLAIAPWHAWRAGELPWHHRDPFDRLLAAQALVEGIPLVTADPRFSPYGVGILW